MLYQICHGAVSFADEEILHDINFEIRNTEKIAGGTAAAKPRS